MKINSGEIQQFLEGIWAFKLLDDGQLASLVPICRLRRVLAGQTLWLQGQVVTFFSIVYEGQFRTYRQSPKGARKRLSTLLPKQHFGLAEMITALGSSVTVVAQEDSTLLTIDHKLLKEKLLGNPEVCYRLMQTMARAIFNLTSQLERASFQTVNVRLGQYLLRLGAGQPEKDRGQEKLIFQGSHEELSGILGAARETVTRAISQFRRKGYIRTAYCRIWLRDAAGLREFLMEHELMDDPGR